MLRKLMFILISMFCFACSSKKNEPTQIANIDQKVANQKDIVSIDLLRKGISYDSDQDEYTTRLNIIKPCDKDTLNTTQTAQKEMSEILVNLGEESKYSGDALDFYRLVSDSNDSLIKINKSFQEYCTNDADLISTCLSDKIEDGFAIEHGEVNPVLSIDVDDKNILSWVFRIIGSEEEIGVSKLGDLSHFENISRVLGYEINLKNFNKIKSCMSKLTLTSDNGKTVVSIITKTVEETEKLCSIADKISIDKKACEP